MDKQAFTTFIQQERCAVLFSANWCTAGKELEKQVKKMNVAVVDVDAHPDLASELAIVEIPTIMFYKKGEHTLRLVDHIPVDMIKLELSS